VGKTTDMLSELRSRAKALPEGSEAGALEQIGRDLDWVETLCQNRKFRSCELWLREAEILIEKLEKET